MLINPVEYVIDRAYFQKWHDEYLAWSDGPMSISLEPHQIWTPDITLINT